MIILHVRYQLNGMTREEFFDVVKAAQIGEGSRRDEGNIEYSYYLPVDTEDEVLLVEIWKDEAALAAHQQSEHVKAWREVKSKYPVESKIVKYQAEEI
ncbi:antibiotic biosynthesis monooxygenase family protein [Hominifimenecus sp. rT4P-3]|uniref:antibiotic biosynthesis monooxygenase family protein n=1 Tax=Hominifimenecus sp. rT4P-3 TaxID=3242979 RepID=UPI003DA33F60